MTSCLRLRQGECLLIVEYNGDGDDGDRNGVNDSVARLFNI